MCFEFFHQILNAQVVRFFFFSAHSGAHNAKAEVKIWRFQTRGFHGTLVIRLFGRLTARFCLDVSRCQAVLWSAPVSLSLCCCPVCLRSVGCSGPEKALGWPGQKAPMWVSPGSRPPFIILTTASGPAQTSPQQ